MDFEKAKQVLKKLKRAYPNAGCQLEYSSDFQLLTAVILSAQCTDKRVNQVTQKLFKIADTPCKMLELGVDKLEKLVYSCGFYHSKSKNLISASKDLIDRFGGNVPDDFESLVSLKGVGRKTANVILSVAFNKEAIAVDTHVLRISNRLGLSNKKTPHGVEKDLVLLFKGLKPGQDNIGYSLGEIHHLLIFHGRYCCRSRNPNCKDCPVKDDCGYLFFNKSKCKEY